jgi:nucleotide-binding universal stress UspA family protein
MPGIEGILHPTDFSVDSRYAFETACSLARSNAARLFILHVMMPSSSPVLQAPPPDPMRAAETQESIPPMPWPQASDPQLRVEHRVTEGDPADEILRLAEALHCDLIVMGTHGRTGLRRLLTGSVAEAVLRRAACPVLVVRTPVRPAEDLRAEALAGSGDLIDLRPLGPALGSARTRTISRSSTVELVRLIVRSGQEVPEHKCPGELIVHCLEGRVVLTTLGKTETLEAGKLLILPAGEPHALKGIEDASLLLTIIRPKS